MPRKVFHQLFKFSVEFETFFFGQHFGATVFFHRFDLFQTFDRILNGLIICHQTAKPAIIDVILSAAFGFFLNRFLCLTFCADKKHFQIRLFRISILNKCKRVAEKFLRFLQVNNINAVAFTKNVFFHFRIPTANLVTKVNSCFEKFFHRYCSQNLKSPYFIGLCTRRSCFVNQ